MSDITHGYLIKPTVMHTVKVYKCHPDAVIPTIKEQESAGYDLACVEPFELLPGDRAVVRTGLVIQPPPGYHTEILLRSSLAYKYNIMLINSVGLIDRSYAGEGDELKVMLYRAPTTSLDVDPQAAVFKPGDRIAQLVFTTTNLLNIEEVGQPPATEDRGGLGSTGK